MNAVFYILAAIGLLLVAAIAVQAYLMRNTTRRLSDMRPDPATIRRKRWAVDPVAAAHDEARRLEENPPQLAHRPKGTDTNRPEDGHAKGHNHE